MKMNKKLVAALIAVAAPLLTTNAFAAKYPADGTGHAVRDGYGNCVMINDLHANLSHCGGTMPTTKMINLSSKTLFDFNKAELKPAGKSAITLLLHNAGIDNIKHINVTGYTDDVGSDAYNMALSKRRAMSVKDYMVSKGVPASKIQAYGLGESNPVANNTSEAGRAKNRRVEIEINCSRCEM